MDNIETIEIHKDLLKLLNKFNEICVNNGIKYSLHGGTLLGAIREKGFIPWDDDIDVAFTREEYNKFCNVMNNLSITGEYVFDQYSNKIPVLRYSREDSKPVWLDIFIYDYISENVLLQRIKILLLVALTAFTKTKTTIEISNQRKSERNIFSRFLFNIIYYIGKLFNQKFKINLFHNFASKCFVGKREIIQRSNDQYNGIGLNKLLPKKYMEEYIVVDFENTKLMVSKEYHLLLVNFYGEDYMIPRRPSINDINIHNIARNSLRINYV